MKIVVDIGHPAHVHYFRNFIKLMQEKGHEFFISARERSIIPYLLDHYKIPWYNRGKGRNGAMGKIMYMFQADMKLLKQARKFKPDMFISFGSPYAAQVAWLMGKPHVVLDDTEHARFGHMFYKPFSSTFLNPHCFLKDFGPKQVRFNSFMELFYLHPNRFAPDPGILKFLGITPKEKFILLRFVSWDANHDIGHSGLTDTTKKELVQYLLEKEYKVLISSESEKIDEFFTPFLIKIPPEKMHDVLAAAHMLIAESGTMASEAVILGTPVVYVNSLPLMGYLAEQKEAGILFHFPSSEGVFEKVKQLLEDDQFLEKIEHANCQLLKDKIDPTSFLTWFIENYPQSIINAKNNETIKNSVLKL